MPRPVAVFILVKQRVDKFRMIGREKWHAACVNWFSVATRHALSNVPIGLLDALRSRDFLANVLTLGMDSG